MNPAMNLTLRGLLYGLLLWLAGFAAGMIAFMIPMFRVLEPIPGLSFNPAASVLALLTWLVLVPLLARRYVSGQRAPVQQGLRLGILSVCVSGALDYSVLGVAMGNGSSFFAYASIWVGYSILLGVPILVGSRSVK